MTWDSGERHTRRDAGFVARPGRPQRPKDAADDHDDAPAGERPGLPAAQAPRAVPVVRPELRQGPRLLPRGRCRALFGLPAARRGPGGHGAGQERRPELPAGAVRQRPALRRLVVHERGDRPGLRLGPAGPLQGPARVGGDADPAHGPDRRAAGAWRRAVPAGRLRAAGLRGRGRPLSRWTSGSPSGAKARTSR